MKIVISPDYTTLSDYIKDIPTLFSKNKGKIIFNGRNQLRLFNYKGTLFVAKRYKRLNTLKGLIYTFLRKTKAEKAYYNAKELRKRNFSTPKEIAYLLEYRNGLVCYCYYICEYTTSPTICEIKNTCTDKEKIDILTSFATYIAEMHKAGILQKDLNSSNILYNSSSDEKKFSLIDINRMTFYYEGKEVGIEEGFDNLACFDSLNDDYRMILHKYIKERGWKEAIYKLGIRIKNKHDEKWNRKVRFKHLIRKGS